MITTKEAVGIVLNNAKFEDIYEEVYVSDCLGRVSYENVVSKVDIPTFTRSSMDGYAVRFGNENLYKIINEGEKLEPGSCIRVNTGFEIPAFADAVVEVEKAAVKDGYIEIEEEIKKQRNFTKKGSELKKGDILIGTHKRIDVRTRALLAYAGVVSLKVYKKPVVGIITTGNEVVFPGCLAQKNSVFNSNYFILEGLVRKWGAEPVYFGHIPDKKEALKKRLMYALNRCDVLLTTGGVSKGTKDYAKDVLKEVNAKMFFEKSTIKPGKPAAFAAYEDKFIFSLPGWPAALYTTAYLYLKPFLLRISGSENYENMFFEGIIDEDMHSQKGKDYFNRVKIDYKNGEFHLKLVGSQKTDNYFSIAKAEGLVWLDTEKGDEKKGSKLPFLFFDD